MARRKTTRAQSPPVAGGAGLDRRPGEESLPAGQAGARHAGDALGAQADLTVALRHLGLSGRLNTAFIERVHLTVRHAVAALARRTWATAQQFPRRLAHLEWRQASSHCVRPHRSLRLVLVWLHERGGKLVAQRYRQRTEAQVAGRIHRRWTAREVLLCPLPKASA
jgi:hypothetical protein